jgi:hypothetical protein
VRLRELACERFPNDELAAKIAAREAFDAEETEAYAADLDAQVEEQDVLEVARHASPGGVPRGATEGGPRCQRRRLRPLLPQEGR